MLRKLQDLKKRNEGFTIVEVMIVLAIAGLILLIVFLAVPALQRNSRNTQLKNDVASVLGGINEFAANNNGALPVDICTVTNNTDGIVRGVSTGTCGTTSPEIAKVRPGTAVDNGTAMPTATQTMVVILNSKCGTSSTFPSPAVATARAFGIGYVTETSGAVAGQCTEG